MKPEVLAALPDLEAEGILPPAGAALARRLARRDLVSVAAELRILFYVGVLLVTGGAGILVRQNLDAIGPATIAILLGLAAAACLVWVERRAPPFTRERVPTPHPAFEYVLLMGVLLAAADLAWIEVRFTPLGAAWPWHLLVVAIGTGIAAFRWDSRIVFSVALTSFAAWRGLSIGILGQRLIFGTLAAGLRSEAIGTGAVFVVLGWLLRRRGLKPHFEPVAGHLGWLLVLGGSASALGEPALWPYWALALGATSAGLAVSSWRRRRFPRLAFGVVGTYVAVTRFVLEAARDDALGCFWFAASAAALLVGLVAANRRLREDVE